MRNRLLVVALLALVAAASSTSGAAAADGGQLKLTPVKSQFPERTFVLTLPQGLKVGPDQIQLSENGGAVHQLAIAPTAFAGIVLLIDASESMRGEPIRAAMEAARALVKHRRPGQRLAVLSFNAQTHILLPFTRNEEAIERALASTPPVVYYTRMYDAIARAAALSRLEGLDSTSIILLSDGQELDSRTTRQYAVATAQSAGIRIFTVALQSKAFDSSTLRELSSGTGGAYVEAASPEALAGIFDRLGARLANEYLVQYRSLAGPDERVKVTVSVPRLEQTTSVTYTSPALSSRPTPAAFGSSRAEQAAQSPVTMLFVVLLVAALMGISVIAFIRPSTSVLRRRLGAFVSLAQEEPKRQTTALTERLLAGTDHSLGRTRWWDKFKHQLVVAQISLPAEQVVVLTVIGTLFVGWLLYVLVGTPAAIFALGLPMAVRWLIAFRAERERRRFSDQLADNLQVISSALRAGHSFVGALSVVVEEAPEPSRREFRRVVADEQLGVPLDESLQMVGERMRCRDLEQVAMVAALQRETGGNSADVLDQVAENIRERAALRRLVRTLTAQGRMARWIVSFLPVGLLGVIMLLNRGYLEPLFEKTAGRVMLGFAATMIIAGSLVIRRIVDIKV